MWGIKNKKKAPSEYSKKKKKGKEIQLEFGMAKVNLNYKFMILTPGLGVPV